MNSRLPLKINQSTKKKLRDWCSDPKRRNEGWTFSPGGKLMLSPAIIQMIEYFINKDNKKNNILWRKF